MTSLQLIRDASVAVQCMTDNNMARALPQPVTDEEFIHGMDGEDTIENPPDWEEVLERQRDGALMEEEERRRRRLMKGGSDIGLLGWLWWWMMRSQCGSPWTEMTP